MGAGELFILKKIQIFLSLKNNPTLYYLSIKVTSSHFVKKNEADVCGL